MCNFLRMTNWLTHFTDVPEIQQHVTSTLRAILDEVFADIYSSVINFVKSDFFPVSSHSISDHPFDQSAYFILFLETFNTL